METPDFAGKNFPSSRLDETSYCLTSSLDRSFPFFLWLRLVTGLRLMHVHRRHLQTAMRAVSSEVERAIRHRPHQWFCFRKVWED